MKIFGLVGASGSGKTTLMVKVLGELKGRGLKVSTIKHTHHDFDIDSPGKDSHRHREAGAEEVMLTSSARWVLMREHRGAPEPDVNQLIGHMSVVDLLLVEGFKELRCPKMEIHRPSLGKPLRFIGDPDVAAVASDEPLPACSVPVLDINDIPAIADFIIGHGQSIGPTAGNK